MAGALALPLIVAWPAFAHDVSPEDAARIAGRTGLQLWLYVTLGARHMITGYDHLLFLLGVIFYVVRIRDVALLVSLFALGHSITLILGSLNPWSVSPYLVDAVIGLLVAYKGFDNLGGFERLFGARPYCHGDPVRANHRRATKLRKHCECRSRRCGVRTDHLPTWRIFRVKSQTLWFLCIAAAVIGVLFGLGVNSREATVIQETPDEGLAFRFMEAFEFVAAYDEFGRAIPSLQSENLAPASKTMKSETHHIELGLDAGVEYKALMSQGDSLVYSWTVPSGEVYYDFHAHPPDADPDFFTRYKAGEGTRDQGGIVAAYDGQHGWYWLNISDTALTIELRIARFYDEVVELAVD